MYSTNFLIKSITYYHKKEINKKANRVGRLVLKLLSYDWLIKSYIKYLKSLNDPRELNIHQDFYLALGLEGAKKLIPHIPSLPTHLKIWCIEILANYTEEIEYTVFTELLLTGETEVRIHALKHLINYQQAIIINIVIETLKDPDWGVRCQAIIILGELRNKKAIPAINKCLQDNSGIVRNYASRVLQEI